MGVSFVLLESDTNPRSSMQPKDLPEPPDGTRVIITFIDEPFLAYRKDRPGRGDVRWLYFDHNPQPWVTWDYLMRGAHEVHIVPSEPVAKRDPR